MDQMDVSLDVTVSNVEADIIDDGIPIEDIDDMEIDYFFNKCDNLNLDTANKNHSQNKTTDIIELSDDEEIFNKKDVSKHEDLQKGVQNKLQNDVKKPVRPLLFRRIPPKLPVLKIPKAQANRRFKIAIKSKIKIINNDINSVIPPTFAYTLCTTPIVRPQTEKTKPKFIVIKKNTNPNTIQKKYVKDSNVPQNKIFVSSLNQRTKPMVLKTINVQNNKKLIVETNYLKCLKKLAETPSTSKGTWIEPPKSVEKNCYKIVPDFEPKHVMIKEELPKPQDIINVEDITTNKLKYRVSTVGGFKAVHDASGAIVEMIEETPDSPDELGESQEVINFIDQKLLAVTTVQLDDWSVTLSNSTRYCSLCQTLFPSRALLDEHQAQWHPLLVPCVEEKGSYCCHCDTSHDKTSLKIHSQTHKNASHTLTNNAKFKCFMCRERFVSQPTLDAHVSARHMQNLNCHCGKEFPLRELLDDHIKTVHTSRPSAETTSDEPLDRGKGQDQAEIILVQTTALFKCESCEVHFSCYFKAKDNFARCNKSREVGRKCPRCEKLIDQFHGTHLLQHNLKCHLRTYTVNSKNLNVYAECPRCFFHIKLIKNKTFDIHVNNCKGLSEEEVFAERCCGLKLTEQQFRYHIKDHDSNSDYILVKYVVYDPMQDLGRLKKSEDRVCAPNLEPKQEPQEQNKAESSLQSKRFFLSEEVTRLDKHYSLQHNTAVFVCKSCKDNFMSYYCFKKHYEQEQCKKYVNKYTNQQPIGCKLKSYSLYAVNANKLCIFSECPKCRLNFIEKEHFIGHVKHCSGPTDRYVECCGLKFTQHQYSLHEKKHKDDDDREYNIVQKYRLLPQIKI